MFYRMKYLLIPVGCVKLYLKSISFKKNATMKEFGFIGKTKYFQFYSYLLT
jgi:hypothetical protein